ncbi:MAG: hypothetical protein CM15mP84_07430 [Cellvibrionales bacterium]|nr:MAG: hypothetical protein CM15mP84_07430 [Cellvibrionales bacterium]
MVNAETAKSVGSRSIYVTRIRLRIIAVCDRQYAIHVGLISHRFGHPLERDRKHLIDPLYGPDIKIFFDIIRHFLKVAFVFVGITTTPMPPRRAASSFSLRPPIGSTSPRRVISPVIATSAFTGISVKLLTNAVHMANPCARSIFGCRAFRHMDMNITGIVYARCNAK